MATEPQALSVGVLQGPNLNLLGRREPELYGAVALDEVSAALDRLGGELGASIEVVQSNVEGELVDAVQRLGTRVGGFLVNAGGFTHTGVALVDALRSVALPYVEVHLTNTLAREPFRHRSLLSASAVGTVSGFGAYGYELAMRALVFHLRRGG